MLQGQTDTTFDQVPEGFGAIAVMGQEGDIKYTWDPKSPEDVEAARTHFDDLKTKGFLIFRMKRWSRKEQVKDFDPKAGRLMFVAPEDKPTTDGEVVKDFKGDDSKYVAVPQMRGG